MAQKRMFSLQVIDTDRFMDMPTSTQALYFHLGMHGDDDGFVSSPRKIVRAAGCKDDDLKLLAAKGYIIPFESGVIVITDWNTNNTLKNDRYHETVYIEERAQLSTDKTGKYVLGTSMVPERFQMDSKTEPEHNLTKHNRTKGVADKPQNNHFVPPSLEEVTAYVAERKSPVIPQVFIDYYQSKGWMVGRNKMKDWRAACRNAEKWERWNSPSSASAGGNDFADVI